MTGEGVESGGYEVVNHWGFCQCHWEGNRRFEEHEGVWGCASCGDPMHPGTICKAERMGVVPAGTCPGHIGGGRMCEHGKRRPPRVYDPERAKEQRERLARRTAERLARDRARPKKKNDRGWRGWLDVT